MNRRSLLGGLVLLAAPAIVRAESIWVPPRRVSFALPVRCDGGLRWFQIGAYETVRLRERIWKAVIPRWEDRGRFDVAALDLEHRDGGRWGYYDPPENMPVLLRFKSLQGDPITHKVRFQSYPRGWDIATID